MPQRPWAGALAGASAGAAATRCGAAGAGAAFFGSRVATTVCGFFAAGGVSLVNGSSHLPLPRTGAALAGFVVSTGVAARRVPVVFLSSNGSSQSPPDERFDAGATAAVLRGAGRTSSSSSTTVRLVDATCFAFPLRDGGSENGSAHSPGRELIAAACLRVPEPDGGDELRVVVVATAGRALPLDVVGPDPCTTRMMPSSRFCCLGGGV